MQIMHRADLIGELFVDRLGATAPFADVALESAVKAGPGIAFNKNAEIEQVAQRLVLEDKDAIDQNHRSWFGPLCFQLRHMGGKVIKRPVDGLAIFQLRQLGAHLIEIDRMGMIKIGATLPLRRVAEAEKIIVLWQDNALFWPQFFENFLGKRRLSRTAAAANADCFGRHASPISRNLCIRYSWADIDSG